MLPVIAGVALRGIGAGLRVGAAAAGRAAANVAKGSKRVALGGRGPVAAKTAQTGRSMGANVGAAAGAGASAAARGGIFGRMANGAGSGGAIATALFAIDSGMRVLQAIDKGWPSAIHQITVTVTGGPFARIERLWQLCLATAFGKYREGPNWNFGLSNVTYEGVWDITGKVVGLRIVSEVSGILGTVERSSTELYVGALEAAGALLNNPLLSTALESAFPLGVMTTATIAAGLGYSPRRRAVDPIGYLLIGPTQEVVGGRWPSIMNTAADGGRRIVLGGVPIGQTAYPPVNPQAVAQEISALPDEGRMILSSYKWDANFQNPQPPLDNGTRASLTGMVSAALAAPGYFPAKPPKKPTASVWTSISPIIYQSNSPEPFDIKYRIAKFARGIYTWFFASSTDGYTPLPLVSDTLPGVDNSTVKP